MPSAVIVDVVRTPIGKRGGALAGTHAVDLAAHVLRALVDRSAVPLEQIDDVILGCVSQVGEQAVNVARLALLAAGLPESTPGTTVDRQCGSSMQAVHFAAQGVMAGAYDIVIAGGVESMSRLPIGSNVPPDLGHPYEAAGLEERYGPRGGLIHQGLSVELVARKRDISRESMDDYAHESHRRATKAQREGFFHAEIVGTPARAGILDRDEGPRPDVNRDALAALCPVFADDGRVTAGTSSQISDGASAALIMSEERAASLGLTPRARFVAFALAGADPIEMVTAPVPATRAVLRRAALRLDDIDLFEINEAFAAVPILWARELGVDLERVNVNGGACALGHPLGATGTRILATLLSEMERRGSRYGLQTICEGGGLANAYIIERT